MTNVGSASVDAEHLTMTLAPSSGFNTTVHPYALEFEVIIKCVNSNPLSELYHHNLQ